MPEVFETKDPPTIVIKRKYKPKLLSELTSVKPELAKELKTDISRSNISKSLNKIKKVKIEVNPNKYMSSL